jgi:hypothetical protein
LRDLIAAARNFDLKSYYGEAMVRTAGPERMVHLQQCLDNEDALFTINYVVEFYKIISWSFYVG